MKILRIIDRTIPPNIGAIGLQVNSINSELIKMNHKIVTISSMERNYPSVDYKLNTIRCPTNIELLGNRISFKLRSYINSIIKIYKPQIIHSHSHLFYYSIISSIVARKNNIPHFLTIHGLFQPMGPIGDKLQVLYNRLVFKLFFNKSIILVYTDKMKLELFKLGCSAQKIKIIPNAIDTIIFNNNKIISKDKFRILFVGRITKGKKVEFIGKIINQIDKNIKTYKLNSKIEINIIGKGPLEGLVQDIKKRTKNITVNTFGLLNPKEVAEMMNNSDILLQPSRNEGVSRVILEAIAVDLHVFCNTDDGLINFINNNQITNLSHLKEDSQEELNNWVEKIIDFIKNPEAYSISNQILPFSWKNYTERLLQYYHTYLES